MNIPYPKDSVFQRGLQNEFMLICSNLLCQVHKRIGSMFFEIDPIVHCPGRLLHFFNLRSAFPCREVKNLSFADFWPLRSALLGR